MHAERKDRTDGWWLCRTEVVHYRAHTAESGLKAVMLLQGGKRGLPTLEKMLPEYQPRMVTLECGICDVEDGIPLEDYRKNMAKALDLILAQGAIPYSTRSHRSRPNSTARRSSTRHCEPWPGNGEYR